MRLAFSSFALRFTFPLRFSLLAFICAGSLALTQGAASTARAAGEAQADLIMIKSGDEAVARGGTITYSLLVINDGPDTATNVTLTDPLPAQTTFVSAESST